jgi:glycogen debranching enzyme
VENRTGSGVNAVSASLRSTEEAPFYIPATDSPSRPRSTLKHNDTFAVFDSHGDIGAASGAPDGLFDFDTRFLSHLELLINGKQPLQLGSVISDDNLTYYVDLTNPDIYLDDKLTLEKDTVHVTRTIYLSDGSLRQRITLSNYGAQAIRLNLALTFASDFADIFEVRGLRRSRRGKTWSQLLGPGAVLLSYRGLDGALRETALAFEPAPTLQSASSATYSVVLESGIKRSVFVSVSTRGPLPGAPRAHFDSGAGVRRENRRAERCLATVETSNNVLNEVLRRSAADIAMLQTATPDGSYPYAGIPWFSAVFGRDGIITALQMLWIDPSLARGVLKRLAHFQAEVDDASSDAAPGKILHEMRFGELAALREVPFARYYGSVDASPLFVMLAGSYAKRTGDYDLVAEIWPAIERALSWIDGPADIDGDGFIEYARGTETGLANQGWKDSHDAIFHADGRLAQGPIALVEVQGYVYAAKSLAARCASKLGFTERADALWQQAQDLRARFVAAFWCEEIGTYALALDGAKAPCKVRTSNAGHALTTGIADADHARRIADGLLRPAFHSGWGVRTLAAGEVRYNPMSYHNGSVWPHDNSLIAHGLARYAFKSGANEIFEGLVQAASYMDLRRTPELYCGFRRLPGRGPTLYPTACAPQAWAAGAPFLLLQSMLGLEFDPEGRRILLVNPTLPSSADEIVIRNLCLRDASADFVVRQERGAIGIHSLRTAGDLQISLVFDSSVRPHN